MHEHREPAANAATIHTRLGVTPVNRNVSALSFALSLADPLPNRFLSVLPEAGGTKGAPPAAWNAPAMSTDVFLLRHAVVVTMDSPTKVDEVVIAVRAARPDLILIARARDSRHAERLYRLGVTDAVPETTEASLQLAENTLVDLGVPMGLVLASVHEKRDQFRKLFQDAMPEQTRARGPRALRGSVRR